MFNVGDKVKLKDSIPTGTLGYFWAQGITPNTIYNVVSITPIINNQLIFIELESFSLYDADFFELAFTKKSGFDMDMEDV